MSYRYSHTGLGLDIGDVATAASQVLQDPCLYKVTQQVLELREIEAAKAKPKKPRKKPRKPSVPKKPGVGLCQAVKPLDLVIYVRRRPWILPVAGVGIVGGIFLLGLLAGRATK